MISNHEQGLDYNLFFIPKIFAAYTVFGLGASILILLGVIGLMSQAIGQSKCRNERFYWLIGLGALLLPFLFYSLLLFSTRHWTVCIGALVLWTVSEPAGELLNKSKIICGRWVAVSLTAACALLVVGVHMPTVKDISLTNRRATLFPTADGRCPMGAILPFLFSNDRLNHNQQAWQSACAVKKYDEYAGVVPVIYDQIDSIIELAIRLNGQTPAYRIKLDSNGGFPFAYVTSRGLLKDKYYLDKRLRQETSYSSYTLHHVAGAFPVSVLLLDSKVPDEEGSRLKNRMHLLRNIFEGNEFFWETTPIDQGILKEVSARGGKLVFLSGEPFRIGVSAAEEESVRSADHLYYLLVDLREGVEVTKIPNHIFVAYLVYPDYMQLKQMER